MTLLKLLANIKKNFASIFTKTVDSVPGMRMYFLSHAIFDVSDGSNYDWFNQFMQKYLTPTDLEVEDFLKHQEVPDDLKGSMELLSVIEPEYISDLFDDTYIKFGLWSRDSGDRLLPPIAVIDTYDVPDLVVRGSDLREVIRLAGVIDMETGEIVIAE